MAGRKTPVEVGGVCYESITDAARALGVEREVLRARLFPRPTGAARPVFPHGTRHLAEDDVRAIKQRLKVGDTPNVIAKDYGVAQVTIWRIANNITWKDVDS